MRIVIYTAIYGGYDNLKEQPKQSIETDFICFTDSDLQSIGWEVINRNNSNSDIFNSRMKAKVFKIRPHLVDRLKQYDLLIWIDGSAQILSEDFVKHIVEQLGDDQIMCFKHPENRDCIYQEALYCCDMPKYKEQTIMEQSVAYKREGYPEHNGLYACGLMAYNTKKYPLKLMNDWWIENRDRTYQDQISLPYVAWKNGIEIKTLDINQHDNKYITFNNPHSTLL